MLSDRATTGLGGLIAITAILLAVQAATGVRGIPAMSPLWSDLALARAVISDAEGSRDERAKPVDAGETRPVLKFVRRIPRRRVASFAL